LKRDKNILGLVWLGLLWIKGGLLLREGKEGEGKGGGRKGRRGRGERREREGREGSHTLLFHHLGMSVYNQQAVMWKYHIFTMTSVRTRLPTKFC